MKIKDIVNRDLVNLQNCDQEPIHIPGSIQPHGFLIAITKETWEIRFCSENVIDFIGLSHKQLLGKKITEIFDDIFFGKVIQCKDYAVGESKLIQGKIEDKEFDFTAHQNEDVIILESEIHIDNTPKNDLFDMSKQFMDYMEDSHTLIRLCELVASGIKKVTDYDRVMIYRFDKDYNGEVIAEAKQDKLESFLGLHYPHTDIPVQARELYIKNLLRVIGDVNYKPVPIYTIDDSENQNLDLSCSVLRSVSPIHVQYLHNIGVGATLTISLIHKKKLWGLVACHHYSPKYLHYETKLAAKLQGHFITSQIEIREQNEQYATSQKLHQAVDDLISRKFSADRNSLKDIVIDSNVLQLCKAAGISILIDKKEVYKSGLTPADGDIQKLAEYVKHAIDKEQYATHFITAELPDFKNITASGIAGINYHALDKTSNSCIMWYKPETITEVKWAGDPNKAIEKDKNGLSPRKSFELWGEKVKNQSIPWSQPDLIASSNFANFLQKHLGYIFLAEEEEKQRQMTEILKEVNSELENINWISTHDLQEPLRKIQIITSYVLSVENTLSEASYEKLQKINKSANRMQALISDILRYTKLKASTEILESVDLKNIVTEVIQEVDDALEAKKANIYISDLPEMSGIPFLLAQLFLNLISNSLKFADATRVLSIHIVQEGIIVKEEQEYYKISYTDNGIGFNKDYNELIFKIFSRLHSVAEYPGSGIGLALCKKIMKTHKGFIEAQGIPEKGAIFYLYFPVSKNS
ncbi:ATP-binding protein [Cytophaga hutchinsonii]|uniref:histidine kinase n=1 Tax=Cytophaga hutchinsonii (strain ATCC 33406 / DSM 1761 / CIP 103989 / NBRC 15051 / NCIMB 9469 / D465) TaxID=269798 RepID=A0A6N4SME9_CYTH3|nr:ATP-binding protein [Cytophaga hutchinsonii]ABG57443.1 phytochrome sensor signal transduction histidine kinase [Cytophaga hutchinsonii ATCC 33406]SFX98267.1 phytochrome sensor signal transduction histidine kinase [Cytophaga hutchinsonii ATCC 33406]